MKCDVINLSVLHERDHVFKSIFLHYESLTTNTYSEVGGNSVCDYHDANCLHTSEIIFSK